MACAAALAAQLVSGASADEGTEETPDHRVKAAYLCKFASYVEWPATKFPHPDTPITIGVLGADAVAEELLQLVSGHMVDQRPIAARRLKTGEPLAGVDILFIGKQESSHLSEILSAARPLSVLSVTETTGALAQGSIINFTIDEQRVRFEISLTAAEQSNLKLSSRLLGVAQQVLPSSP
ncbi:MAG: YfiR family protein [Betaproteobacteria bacterium]